MLNRKKKILNKIKSIHAILQERIPNQELIEYIMEKLSLVEESGYTFEFNDTELIIKNKEKKTIFILKIDENIIFTKETSENNKEYIREVTIDNGTTLVCSKYTVRNITNNKLTYSNSKTRIERYSDKNLYEVKDSIFETSSSPFSWKIITSEYHIMDSNCTYEVRRIRGNNIELTNYAYLPHVEYYLYDNYVLSPLNSQLSLNSNKKQVTRDEIDSLIESTRSKRKNEPALKRKITNDN